MTFESQVTARIQADHDPTFQWTHFIEFNKDINFVKTQSGIDCAVYLSQGITHTIVALYYQCGNNISCLSDKFLFASKAGTFAGKLASFIEKNDQPEQAWTLARSA